MRGINVGAHKRIAMPALRERLAETGYEEAVTYLASGNIVVGSELEPAALARRFEEHMAQWFGLDVRVVIRTEPELAAVVAANPLASYATEPKRHQVSFLSAELDDDSGARISAAAVPPERVAIIGREVYAWHPDGVIRSPLAKALASPKLGRTITARNWTTVTELLKLARR